MPDNDHMVPGIAYDIDGAPLPHIDDPQHLVDKAIRLYNARERRLRREERKRPRKLREERP